MMRIKQLSRHKRFGIVTIHYLDCKTVGFFLKISKEIDEAWRKSRMRAKRASLTRPSACEASEKKQKKKQRLSPVSLSVFSLAPAFCLTARAYLNTQKYGLFCSLFIT